jgi:hypothetical protein
VRIPTVKRIACADLAIVSFSAKDICRDIEQDQKQEAMSRDRPKPTIQRSKTVIYISKINFNPTNQESCFYKILYIWIPYAFMDKKN